MQTSGKNLLFTGQLIWFYSDFSWPDLQTANRSHLWLLYRAYTDFLHWLSYSTSWENVATLLFLLHFMRIKPLILSQEHEQVNRKRMTVPMTGLEETQNNWQQDVTKVQVLPTPSESVFISNIKKGPRHLETPSFLCSSNIGFSRSNFEYISFLVMFSYPSTYSLFCCFSFKQESVFIDSA